LAANRLGTLQREILEAFFRRESRFYLTGGAALAGYYLGHRDTADLDLFTDAESLADGERALQAAAAEVGGVIENLQTAPDFRRRLIRRGTESVVVDLVREQAPQGTHPKKQFGSVRVDPPEEILANKLCTLLSRAEIRDLVDVLALERTGLRMEDALALATRKDAGLTPAQLAWILSQIAIGDDAAIPGGVSATELRAFLSDLVARLTRLSFPK
jgi:predicted nucleotidyltransferase component of viral defense system